MRYFLLIISALECYGNIFKLASFEGASALLLKSPLSECFEGIYLLLGFGAAPE